MTYSFSTLQNVIVKWVPTCILGYLSTNLVIAEGKAKEAAIALGATVIYPLAYSLGEGFLKGVKKRADERGQAYGESFVDFVVVDLPQQLKWRLSRFEKKYRQSVIDYYRDLKTEGFKIGLPVLDLTDIYVDLKLRTEIPEKAERNILPQLMASDKEDQKIWSFLPQTYNSDDYRNLAIVAPPGYGKTTLLQYLTLVYARKAHGRQKIVYLTPILLFLRNWREEIIQDNSPSLPELIVKAVEKQPAFKQLKQPPQWFEKRLRSGKCLVMLDGLDEVANKEQRIKVSEWINEQMITYSSTPFIVTSRPYGYDSNLFEKVSNVLEVKSFDLEGIKLFIQQWYRQTEIRQRNGRIDPAVIATAQENADDLIGRIVNNPSLIALATNPLLVTMIATVHYTGDALPRRRVELYSKICDVLLGGRLTAKKMQSNLTVGQRKSVLQVLALELMKLETRIFNEASGVDLIRNQLATVDSNLKPEVFLKEIRDVCGLIVEKEIGIYEFAHLSFQEYLVSCEIKKTQQENILSDNFSNSWWAEIIRLYVAQGDASNLIAKGINNGTIYSLSLAYDCEKEGLEVDPKIKNRLENILVEGLQSTDFDIFSIAAEVKLSRRLRGFLEINECLGIDPNFITGPEILFLFYKAERRLSPYPFHLVLERQSEQIITKLSYQDALGLCWELSYWFDSQSQNNEKYYYRLPTEIESKKYPPIEKKNESFYAWNSYNDTIQNKHIRLVKTKTPSIFNFETVTVNDRKEISERKVHYAQYIVEDLDNDTELEMVYIPGGSFIMGSPVRKGEENERPKHQVTVPAFFMGKYPITQAQYQQIMGINPSKVKGDKLPVERVSWEDTQEFCRRISNKTGNKYRLPSEAEWEYACRAKTTSSYHFGETIISGLANHDNNVRTTSLVGKFPANRFGLYDMHGNVWEWCQDDWHDDYINHPTDGKDWLNRFGNPKVIRGGSWNDNPNVCRSAYRSRYHCVNRNDTLGFRVVCEFPRTL